MRGAKENLTSPEPVAQMTDAELAQARRRARAWTERAKQHCDRELFASDNFGQRRLDCDLALALIDP